MDDRLRSGAGARIAPVAVARSADNGAMPTTPISEPPPTVAPDLDTLLEARARDRGHLPRGAARGDRGRRARRPRTLVVQRTGWGKSLVYWLATRVLRDRGQGPTLVISPLLALMRDQLAMPRIGSACGP